MILTFIFNKLMTLLQETLKETVAQVFSVNFAKFLKIPFLQNTSTYMLN